jgi:hypothetical protein
VDRFLDEFGQTHFDDLALIRYHVWWPSNQDPFYLANSSHSSARVNYYDVGWVPYALVDGVYTSSNAQFQSRFNQRVTLESPFAMEIAAQVIGDSVDVSLQVYAEGDPGADALRLRIVVCETNIEYHGAYGDVWNEVMRTMVPDASGTVLAISQGDTIDVSGWFRMNQIWDMANLSIVAFVQNEVTHEILQGARWLPPAGVVQGTVQGEGGAPVADALVTLLGTGRYDTSDDQGAFTLSYLVGSYGVEAKAVGYYPDTVTVDIFDDSTTTVGVALTALPTSLFAGTVTDSIAGEGISAEVVLLMNGEPWDSASTNPATGFFHIQDLPISYPDLMEYTGVVISPEMPYPVTAMYQTITIAEDDTATLYAKLNPADVLVIDDDEGMEYENYYVPAIDSAGRTYVHLDAVTSPVPPDEALGLFPQATRLVWFTGNATTSTLTSAEQDSLSSFLGRGGKLFLTGQNIAEELSALESPFLEDYLHVSWLENATQGFLHGTPGDPLGRNAEFVVTVGTNGANNQTSRDKLGLLDDANESFYYVATPTDTTHMGTGGIWAEGPAAGSRIVFFGFGFEAVNRPGSDQRQATRSELMRLVLDWLDGIVGVDEPEGDGGSDLPRSYSLGQNYPNPFNPQTTISFEIPSFGEKGMHVLLSVYDLRGRKVKTLVDGVRAPGRHSVQWDGRDDGGAGLASGIYFYRLEAGDFVQTRKLLLVE